MWNWFRGMKQYIHTILSLQQNDRNIWIQKTMAIYHGSKVRNVAMKLAGKADKSKDR